MVGDKANVQGSWSASTRSGQLVYVPMQTAPAASLENGSHERSSNIRAGMGLRGWRREETEAQWSGNDSVQVTQLADCRAWLGL